MEKVRLGECATFINGYAFKPIDWSRNGIPIIRIQNLTGSMKQLNYYNGKLDSKYIINNGDILISWSASLGIFEWKKEKAYLNQHIFKVEFNKKNINKKYFVYLIKSKINEMKKNTHGSTMKHITKSDFDKIEIFLPNIQEQEKISNILDKVQEIIDLRKKQIEELDEIIKSQFVEMFGNKNNWNEVTLNDTSIKITDGEHGTVPRVDNGKLYLMARNITTSNTIDLSEVTYIPEENYRKIYKRCNPEKDDLLLVCVGATVGKVALVPEMEEFSIARSVALIKPNKKVISSLFLLSLMNSHYMQSQIKNCVHAVAQAGLYTNMIKELKFKLPPIGLQNQFGDIVKQINKQKFIIEKSLKETEELQESLMNKYFGE